MNIKKPTILTIATNESSGVAGIQADVKTIAANGGYATTVVTAIAAQNTQGVFGVEKMSNEIIEKQLKAVQEDMDVKAIKIGLIKYEDSVNQVFETIDKSIPIILDPVLLTMDLDKEFEETNLAPVANKLLGISYLITPSTDEAAKILKKEISNVEDMIEACYELEKLGAKNVLIKGSHLDGPIITDVLLYNGEIYKFDVERMNLPLVHGAGCSLSTAIATNIGKGMDLLKATEEALEYVRKAIQKQLVVGKGWGAIGHF